MLYWDRGLMAYGRFTDGDRIVVVINREESWQDAVLPVWLVGQPKRSSMKSLLLTYTDGFSRKSEDYTVTEGMLEISMPPVSGVVLQG